MLAVNGYMLVVNNWPKLQAGVRRLPEIMTCRPGLNNSQPCRACLNTIQNNRITYLPHEAVAEVSNRNEPIGRKCGVQLVRKSIDIRLNCFELQVV